MGYHRAGFDVVGVDIEQQPRYPFTFVQADALEYLRQHGGEFDAIHASPPCQAHTQMSARWRRVEGTLSALRVDLLTPTLAVLRESFDAHPWVVENVMGARKLMRGNTITMHGGMFGLGVHRPRIFASNVLLMVPQAAQAKGIIGVYGKRPDGRRLWSNAPNSVLRAAKSLEEASAAMGGVDWMEWREVAESIPPVYTEFIGRQLIRHSR